MTEKSADKKYEIVPPLTKGEQYQLEKLKRFSEDPAEIKKVRRKLQNAGYGDDTADSSSEQNGMRPSESAQNGEEVRKDADDNTTGLAENRQNVKKSKTKSPSTGNYLPSQPQRRREDRPAFPGFTAGFLKSLIAMFTNYSRFTEKYGRKRFIKLSFLNLFCHGCGFVLGTETQKFIKHTIFKWQDTFRPLFIKLYKTGWRDEQGKPVLSPLEFNLLQVACRLASERGIMETQSRVKDTKYIFARANPFMYCYYQLINAGLHRLLLAFKKGLKNLSRQETMARICEQYDDYKLNLIEFFDGRVEENFIIPLLEAVTGNTLDTETIRMEAFVEPIDEEEFRADGNLKIRMAIKARQYEKEFKKKLNALTKELAFLETVKQDLDYVYYSIDDKNYSAIPLALAVTVKESNTSQTGNNLPIGRRTQTVAKQTSGGSHIIKDIYYALGFFLDFYTALLTEKIPVYGERGVEYVELFNKNVFGDNCKELPLLHKSLIHYFKMDFARVTTEAPERDYRKSRCLQQVEKICTQIYAIGTKLYKATGASVQAKSSFKGLDILNLGKFKIPFEERKLFSHLSRSQGPLTFSLHNKAIKEVMRDIRVFCFDFLRYFEPPLPSDKTTASKPGTMAGAGGNVKLLQPAPEEHILQASTSPTAWGEDESIFLDTLTLPEDDIRPVPKITGHSPADNSQVQPQKRFKKTLLARLENFNEIKTAIEKLKKGEEIADVPDEPQP